LFPVFIDYADLARADAIVDANKRLCCSFIESDGAPPQGCSRRHLMARFAAGRRTHP
jgi:hypothetical protein